MRLLKKSLYGLAVAALVLTGVITPASADVREVGVGETRSGH